MHTFKFVPVTHSPTRPRVLDIDDVLKKMDASPDAGPSREEDLRFEEWRTAMENLLQFEVEVYKKEDAARPLFLAEHMRFFDKPEAGESYAFWLGMEIRLRREHYSYQVAFNRMTYVTEYSHCFKSWEDSKKAPVYSGRIPSLSSSSSNHRHQPYPPKQPFLSSSNGTPPPRCVGCGKAGHTLNEHKPEHGRFPFVSKGTDGAIFSPNGTRVCVYFNIWTRPCTHPACSSKNHICSLCGKNHSARSNHAECAIRL
ncbi:hypothetical protein EV361DRAFT_13496 [Lentinula raphanica]|nr:hypothetical protein EV361DRAFT_13496 [Lentinula raphanica]